MDTSMLIPLDENAHSDWKEATCDKYDYLIATFCGVAAGLIDIIFVREPSSSPLGDLSDKAADSFVQRTAKFFYNHDSRTEGKPKHIPDTLEKSISYLEQAFPVKYDARNAADLLGLQDGQLKGMNSKNHHLLSLGHSPDIVGLVFSILNQFSNTPSASFIDSGKIITVTPNKTSKAIPYLQGSNIQSKLFCGFINWIGHIISDMVGSSSTRVPNKEGRGMGVPIPFYELLLLCDFGDFNGDAFAEMMVKVYEQGYELRFGIAMSIPVIFEELMVRSIWAIRQKFFKKAAWKDSIPTGRHADLRIMLIISNTTLCLFDGADAAIHGIKDQSWISCALHLNFIGWSRLVILLIKETAIRIGLSAGEYDNSILKSIFGKLSDEEKARAAEIGQNIISLGSSLKAYDQFKIALKEQYLATKEREKIEAECNKSIKQIQGCRAEIIETVEDYLVCHMEAYEESLQMMEDAIYDNNSEGFISANSLLQSALGRESQFTNQQEFNDLMDSDVEFIL